MADSIVELFDIEHFEFKAVLFEAGLNVLELVVGRTFVLVKIVEIFCNHIDKMGHVQCLLYFLSWQLIFARPSGHTKDVYSFLVEDKILCLNGLYCLTYKFHFKLLAYSFQKLMFFECFWNNVVVRLLVKNIANELFFFQLGNFRGAPYTVICYEFILAEYVLG